MNTLELPPSWPDTAPTEILPGLSQGGTGESSLLGMPTKAGHYRGERPFDLIVTLCADALLAPWGVDEVRYGFPDAALEPRDFNCLQKIAACTAERWRTGGRVLIRCQAGVNHSGPVTPLVLLSEGSEPRLILGYLRASRSPPLLPNSHFREVVPRGDGSRSQSAVVAPD